MEKERTGFLKTPAPIFAKKPRQALLAHPNNSNSNNDHNGSYSGRTASHSRSFQQNSFVNNRNDFAKSKPSRMQDASLRSLDHLHGSETRRMLTNGNVTKQINSYGTTRSRQQINSGVQGDYTSSSYPQQLMQQRDNDITYVPNQSTGYGSNWSVPQMMSKSVQQSTSNYIPPLSRFTQNQYPKNHQNQAHYDNDYLTNGRQQSINGSQPTYFSPAKGCQSYGSAVVPDAMSNWNNPNQNSNNKSSIDFNQINQYTQRKEKVVHNAVPPNYQTQANAKTGNAKEFKVQLKEAENSLRMITASIQGLKQWASSASKVPIIFEVFGNVSSAVPSTKQPNAKEFILQDDTDAIKCLFYEIDRNLAKFTHGQFYRCVGKWYSSEQGFHCLSIRHASDEERKVYRLRINASDRSMRAWKLKNSEF